MQTQEKKKNSGLSFISFPFLEEFNIFCGFTSRYEGYSKKPYDSLNLAYHVGEKRKIVRKNRMLILRDMLNMDSGHLFSARQVHGNDVIYVSQDIGHRDGDIPLDADALMTDVKNTPVMVMGADCSLILMADIRKKAVCAVHAGWKGTLNGITLNVLKLFCRRFGSSIRDIYVFIGPGIRQCCYEIDNRIAQRFIDIRGDSSFMDIRDGRTYLDLVGSNLSQLSSSGILEDNIFDTGICTGCNTCYYSFRRDGITGRHAGIAMVF